MKFDTIERVGHSEVHHGSLSDRVYLAKLHEADLGDIFGKVEDLAREKHYGKIVSKVPRWALDTFLEHGYRVEAEIPGLYRGATDGYFVAGYPKENRCQRPEKEERFIESVKTIALATSDTSPKVPFDGYEVRRLRQAQMPELAALHQKVFSSYPYPVFDPDYLIACLGQDFQFYGLYHGDTLVEAAIVLVNPEESHAEIIDFAISSNLKGQNLSYHLLGTIKKAAVEQAIKTVYASVRATSYGLNITFSKQGFHYGGTLVNNTCVGSQLESMNIWYLHCGGSCDPAPHPCKEVGEPKLPGRS